MKFPVKFTPLLIATLLLGGCTSNSTALRTLKAEGYTNVKLTGYRWFGCGKDDRFHDGFTATGPGGTEISGVVCSGWLKGATVRLD